MTTSDITTRPLTATDLDRFLALEGTSYGPPGRVFLTTAAENHYRPVRAERIVADTDTGNRPMAAAFERAGYRVMARRIVMT